MILAAATAAVPTISMAQAAQGGTPPSAAGTPPARSAAPGTMVIIPHVLAQNAEQPPPAQPNTQPPASDSQDAVQRDLQQQRVILTDPASTPQAREEAARRLVSRGTPEADNILLDVLRPGRDEAHLAVARALATDPTPDPRFIQPLGNLLGANQFLTESAARALASYKTSNDARERLLRFVNTSTQSEASRMAVARAMGTLVDQRTAAGLIDLINKPDESSRVRSAALDALMEMTGETSNGRDVQRWNNWWAASRVMGPAQWANEVLGNKAVRLTDAEKRLRALLNSYEEELRRQFARIPEAERGAFIAARIQDASEDVRLMGVGLAVEEMLQGRRNPQVLTVLRERIGDSSIEVRKRVASTLRLWNDPGAVDALLAQLAQETDTDVRIEIIGALGPTRDIRSVDPLVRLLGDDTIAVAKAAADALKDPAMASELRKEANRDRAAAVAGALLTRLQAADKNNPALRPLRTSVAEAMGQLGHTTFKEPFARLIDPNNEPNDRVRVAALRGLGLIADANLANWVVAALKDEADTVRLAACEALRTCGTFENARPLQALISAQTEPDPTIRKAAWETLVVLLEKALAARDLDYWAQALKTPNPTIEDRTRRATVFSIQEKMLAASNAPNAPRDLAQVRQTLGDELLGLAQADAANMKTHAEEAARRFRLALDYWDKNNAPPAVRDTLSQQYVEALMRARQFVEASQFVIASVQNGIDVGVMWRKCRGEVDRLIKLEDWTTAEALITELQKVPWTDLYSPTLERLRAQVANKERSGGFIWVNGFEAEPFFPFFPYPLV